MKKILVFNLIIMTIIYIIIFVWFTWLILRNLVLIYVWFINNKPLFYQIFNTIELLFFVLCLIII